MRPILGNGQLEIGDHAPWFGMPNQHGNTVFLRNIANRPILLLFYASDRSAECLQLLKELNAAMPRLQAADVHVLSISIDTPEQRLETSKNHQIEFSLLSDADMEFSPRYSVCGVNPETQEKVYSRTAVLLDPNLRVLTIARRLSTMTDIIERTLQVATHYPSTPYPAQRHAPVLYIPQVLIREFCQHLIDVWEKQGNEESGMMVRDGEKTRGVLDYGTKIRRDHFMQDQALMDEVDRQINKRVVPEIEKSFNYIVTCREKYKIACYDGENKGFFKAHRDNTTGATKHRVWAMTLNLNAEAYEGGTLWFPEYGPAYYKPNTGDAVVFSCSLLHEATPVLSGKRFVLLSFLYNEEGSKQKHAYQSANLTHYDDGMFNEKPEPLVSSLN